MLVGIVAGVVSARADAGLSGWDQLGIVVAGSLLAAAVLSGIQLLWKRTHQPEVTIECGDGTDFQRQVAPEARHIHISGGTDIASVHMSRLRVRETKDHLARSVHIQVDAGELRPGLQWIDGSDTYDIPPSGRAFVRLCELVNGRFDERYTVSSVPGLEPGSFVRFELAVLVSGKRRKRQKFVADWTDEYADYPTVTRT